MSHQIVTDLRSCESLVRSRDLYKYIFKAKVCQFNLSVKFVSKVYLQIEDVETHPNPVVT